MLPGKPFSEANRSSDDLRVVGRFVLLVGVVSLFADATYEGARSVLGPYLSELRSGLVVAGALAGVGEASAYALRLASGYLADRWRAYWSFTTVGYVVNLAAVPLLALARSWQAAAVLVVLERAGKGLRGPARDAILSRATAQFGHGKAFGIHETLDQIGAMAGPLWLALTLTTGLPMRAALASLMLPAALAVASLALAYRWWHQHIRSIDTGQLQSGAAGRRVQETAERATSERGRFRLFLIFVLLTNIGFANWLFLGYRLQASGTLTARTVALIYAIAMAIDAELAIPLGRAFDRFGMHTLPIAVATAWAATVVGILAGGPLAASGAALAWGTAMCFQETVFKAVVARLVPEAWRATGYGWLHASQGIGWLIGGALLGFAYENQGARVAAGVATAFSVAALGLSMLLTRHADRSYVTETRQCS